MSGLDHAIAGLSGGGLLIALAVALYGAVALLERRVVDWTPRTDPGGP